MNWTKFKREFTLDPIELMMRSHDVKNRILPLIYAGSPEARREGIRDLWMSGFAWACILGLGVAMVIALLSGDGESSKAIVAPLPDGY